MTIRSQPLAEAAAAHAARDHAPAERGTVRRQERARGFQVEANNVSDARLTAVERESRVPDDLVSCHTAKVGGYIVEGHVPAEDIQRMLREKPAIAGEQVMLPEIVTEPVATHVPIGPFRVALAEVAYGRPLSHQEQALYESQVRAAWRLSLGRAIEAQLQLMAQGRTISRRDAAVHLREFISAASLMRRTGPARS